MLIGFAGAAGAGKDSAAKALVKAGAERRAFADPIRSLLYALNPYVDDCACRLADLVHDEGWETAKRNTPEVRRLLQQLGSEVRKTAEPSYWIDLTLANLPAFAVVTDVRYPNEAQAIRERGGMIVQINRPGFEPLLEHESETPLQPDLVDVVIANDGNVEQLHDRVLAALNELAPAWL
jgi:dephospho-CoA kinase